MLAHTMSLAIIPLLLSLSSLLSPTLQSQPLTSPTNFNFKRYIQPYNEHTLYTALSYSSPLLVFYGARWCRHSRSFNSTYQRVYDYTLGRENMPSYGYYDITDPRVEEGHKKIGIRGFPSLVYFKDNLYWVFEGERKEETVLKWIDDIRKGDWKRGKKLPDMRPGVKAPDSTIMDELASAYADFEYTVWYHYKNAFGFFMVAVIIVLGSMAVVLYILCVLIVEWAGWSDFGRTESEIDNDPVEKILREAEGRDLDPPTTQSRQPSTTHPRAPIKLHRIDQHKKDK